MLNQYSLTSTEDGYSFTTDAGIVYAIYFTVHYLKDIDGQEFTVPSLGFGPIGEKSNFYDVKIKNTIIAVVEDFFRKNQDEGLLYLCMTNDGKARNRRITFGRWYKEINSELEKFDCGEHITREGYYMSLLIKSDSYRKDEIVAAFYNYLNEYFPAPLVSAV